MASTTVGDEVRLEEAARAGWLCYVAGHTQDEMARIPGVSRRSAQRLVGRAASMGPVKVRIDHPIARCVELGHELVERFGLRLAEVCPSTPETPDLLAGVAAAAGAHIERVMQDKTPRIVSLGTGRALGAAVERGVPMERPQHRVVGRVGAMLGDGSAIPSDAAVRLAERTGARCHPMGAPARARPRGGRLAARPAGRRERPRPRFASRDLLCRRGWMGADSPLLVDGFVGPNEMAALEAAGEITGWAFDPDGHLIEGPANKRVPSARLQAPPRRPIVVVGAGPAKADALAAALRGSLVDGVVTDEAAADVILERPDGALQAG